MARLRRRQEIDRWIVITAGALALIGAVIVYSASAMVAESDFSDDAFFFTRQLAWLMLSVVVVYLLSKVDYHIYQRLAWPLALLSLVLLGVVLLTDPINEARRWIDLKVAMFQPTELFKLAMVIFLASALAVKKDRITRLRSVLFPIMPVVALGLVLIMIEPSLGSALVLATLVFVMFFIAGVKPLPLFVFTSGVATAAYFIIFVGGYKLQRMIGWYDALLDPMKAHHQVKQSILAIGSGALVGKGLGRGSAKLFYLPAPHTDFIFATLAEEGGFIFAFVLLVAIGVLVWRGFRTAVHAADLLGFYLALGVTILICAQATINLMVATALLPVTGLPLPLISYGGSSLIFTAAGLGILLNVSRSTVVSPQLFKGRGK